MSKRRTITDRTRARVIRPPDDETRERIRNGLDSLREFGNLIGGLVNAAGEKSERQENPEEYGDNPENEGADVVVWPEIAEHIDVELYQDTIAEIADLGYRLDAEDSPDADRFLAAQHYLELLEDGAADCDEGYVIQTWRTWVERAKQKAPEFEEQIEDFLL